MFQVEEWIEIVNLKTQVAYSTIKKEGYTKINLVRLSAESGNFNKVNSVDFMTKEFLFQKGDRLRISLILNNEKHVICDGTVSHIDWNGYLYHYFVIDNNNFDLVIPSLQFSIKCNFNFGDLRCGFNLEENKLTVTIIEKGRNYLKLDSNYFDSYPRHVRIKQKLLDYIAYAVQEDTMYLFEAEKFSLGEAYLYPVCNKTLDDCILFGNVKNYGGFVYLPSQSDLQV